MQQEQVARDHGTLAIQLAESGRWPEALHHAHECNRLAPANSVLAVWALHALACIYSDAGRPSRALIYAKDYLKEARSFPTLERYTPFVLRHMGRIMYQQKRFTVAFSWHVRAQTVFARLGASSQVAQSSLNMAWSLVRAGRPGAARSVLSSKENFAPDATHLYEGTMAAILSAEGDYAGAVEHGRRALSASIRLSHDFVDAAEVALILADALRRLGQAEESSAFIDHAAHFAALQMQDVLTLLRLTERAEGGESSDSETAAHGSADLRHRGCYCSGVA